MCTGLIKDVFVVHHQVLLSIPRNNINNNNICKSMIGVVRITNISFKRLDVLVPGIRQVNSIDN